MNTDKRRRIMIVDDEYDVVYSLRTVLEETKLFQVDGYVDPMLALSNFKADTYDLVVLDIRMSRMDGFELYKNIKAIDVRIKVCFLTAVNDLSEYKINYPDVIEEIECGKIDCFMDKPVAGAQLLNLISKVIS
jgi:two-component system catabolic regulation response regulator CreB/two-component system response regulator ChvI